MANVITQIEIMKFAGMDKAIFPKGTVITPSAVDWAKDHKISIVTDECCENQIQALVKTPENEREKAELLNSTIKAVIKHMDQAGGFLKKDELVETVSACLQKMGCKVLK